MSEQMPIIFKLNINLNAIHLQTFEGCKFHKFTVDSALMKLEASK